MPDIKIQRPMAHSYFLGAVLLALASACGEGPAPEANATWEETPRDELSAAQDELLDQFVDAQKDLASSLFQELQAAIKASGHSEAIGVCQERAPAIAEAVGQRHGVRIGRTSAKLRNPENTPPAWTADLVESAPTEKLLARGDDLRGMFPIVIAAPCLACHGPADGLAAGVPEALDQRYPADQAIGYAEGDLRGWFWIESLPE